MSGPTAAPQDGLGHRKAKHLGPSPIALLMYSEKVGE